MLNKLQKRVERENDLCVNFKFYITQKVKTNNNDKSQVS